MKTIQYGLTFELSKDTFTAKIIGSLDIKDDIIIPKFINYQSNDYLITTISKFAFKGQKSIKSLGFTEDSSLKVIEKHAFFRSTITHLTLPSSIETLEEGWCYSTPKLISISVSPQNHHFTFYDEKFLLGKTDLKGEKFDLLLFARRDIEQVILPSFVTKICKYSFFDCKALKSIEFPENTEIQTIQKSSFCNSSIEKVQIPSTLKVLEEGWCKKANKLKTVSISPLNNLFSFEREILFGKSGQNNDQFDIILFASRSIKKVEIPANVKRICSYSFEDCKALKSIKFASNSELESIGTKSFCSTPIERVTIPSSVTSIDKSAFLLCKSLKEVNFQRDSKLTTINEDAFIMTSIEQITIPSNVVEIKSGSFDHCVRLKSIKFEENSKLQKIGDVSFTLTLLNSICFPSSLIEIGAQSFKGCFNLTCIEFPADSRLKTIKEFAFMQSAVKSICIPSSVKEIGKCAFCRCDNLESIQFEKGSEIEIIETDLFNKSSIQSFSIADNVKEIKEKWCRSSPNLNKIIVSPLNKHFKYVNNEFLFKKSDIKSDDFDTLIFARRDIKNAVIPSFTKYIGRDVFKDCMELKTVNFESNSQLISIGKSAFARSSVESIFIPSTVKLIDESAFEICQFLEKIDNFENLQIRSIENETFNWSGLQSISIPSTVEELKEGWCIGTAKLVHCFISPSNPNFSIINEKVLVGKTNKKSDTFDIVHFCNRNVNRIMIPSIIKKIDSYAFCDCILLNTVEISENSHLTSIEKAAFRATGIRKISIPSSVEKIGQCAFSHCGSLRSIIFDESSNLCIIEKGAFQGSSIKSSVIPRNVKKINELVFDSCFFLCSIEFLGDEISFENLSVNSSDSLRVISFPNANKIYNIMENKNFLKNDVSIFVPAKSNVFS